MFFFRRILKQLLLTALIGFVIRKAMASKNPRVSRVAQQTNRYLGGFVGLDETGRRAPRSRRVGRSAGSAVIGGVVSYFLDPQQGYDRRQRVKTYASERMSRNRDPLALPGATTTTTSAPAVERAVPRAATA